LNLTPLQQKLCKVLQKGLGICERPFEEIAKNLDSNEKEIIKQTLQLKEQGILRRIGPVINYVSLGRVSTLVTTSIKEEKIQEVTNAVNALSNVSHNYLRRHNFNLWFTLQGITEKEISGTLESLERKLDVTFHTLPSLEVFKLDVRFDIEEKNPLAVDEDYYVPDDKVVKLEETERKVISGLQQGVKIVSRPFDFLYNSQLDKKKVLDVIQGLIAKGVIRRIGGIVNHRKLGFEANVMFVCEVPVQNLSQVGRRLACFKAVSHCYERKTFEGWPYNLFAMIHAQKKEQIQQLITTFTDSEDIKSFALLETDREVKKEPVKYHFT
jgi:DNA-binding Lrp family transcriptional regulator